MIIKGFYHIYCINHWYSIVTDQLRILLTSGLYDAADEINIGCIGDEKERNLLKRLIVDLYPKLHIGYENDRPEDFEFRTLKLIEADPAFNVGFYFHTKAVTKPRDAIQNHWRAWLNEAILNRWDDHYSKILEGYDVSSVNHCKPPLHPEHFSGNFWWFNRSYIEKLPKIDHLDWKHRWNAEQYVCMCRDKKVWAKEFVEPGRDVFLMQYK